MRLQCGSTPGESKGVCITEAIARHIRTALSRTAAKSVRGDAFKYIIHYMADIHQPLHVALERDQGGNLLSPANPFKGSNLHRVWDEELYKLSVKWLNEPSTEFIAPAVDKTFNRELVSDDGAVQGLLADIAFETASDVTCQLAYRGFGAVPRIRRPVPVDLSSEYISDSKPAIAIQIHRAGERLASLIRSIVSARAAAAGPRAAGRAGR